MQGHSHTISYKTSSPCSLATSPPTLIILIPALLLVVFPLLLLPLPIPLLRFKFLLPQLPRLLLIQVGEDQVEDLAVPFDGVAGDAFFDILVKKLAQTHFIGGVDLVGRGDRIPQATRANRSDYPWGK